MHATQKRFVTLAMNEPWGVMGIVCPDEAPLLGLRLAGRAGDRDGQSRSSSCPPPRIRWRATDFYPVLETSDVPAGVVNIVTGEADVLAKTLAEHDGVDAIWYAGSAEGAKAVEAASAGNLKATWTLGAGLDWRAAAGARVSAPRDAGEEHLDALRGVRRFDVTVHTPPSIHGHEAAVSTNGQSHARLRLPPTRSG